MDGKTEFINPEGLHHNPAFTQVVTTRGNGKTIYIGGQNAVSQSGEITGKGDLAAQTVQVMENLGIALKSCGADFKDLIKLNIHIVQGQNAYAAFQVSQKYLGQNPNPPAITVLVVQGLANPDFLLEIDGVAFSPE